MCDTQYGGHLPKPSMARDVLAVRGGTRQTERDTLAILGRHRAVRPRRRPREDARVGRRLRARMGRNPMD